MRRVVQHIIGVFALAIAFATTASATSISRNPHQTLRLSTGELLIFSGPDELMLYDRTGVARRRFSIAKVIVFDVSADERNIVAASYDGRIALFDLQTGGLLWNHSAAQTRLRFPHDLSFARDGQSFIACNSDDNAIVYDTQNGNVKCVVTFPPDQTRVSSAALLPDGSGGALVDGSQRIYFFDTKHGKLVPLNVGGAWPIRYSVDGTFFAFRSGNSGRSEAIRICPTSRPSEYFDVGTFARVGRIKPDAHGGFLVTAEMGDRSSGPSSIAGFYCDPVGRSADELWNWPISSPWTLERLTDFDPSEMVGVSTSYGYLTTVTDLETSETLVTIDNRKNYRSPSRRWNGGLVIEVVVAGWLVLCAVAVAQAVASWMRKRRDRRARGFPLVDTK